MAERSRAHLPLLLALCALACGKREPDAAQKSAVPAEQAPPAGQPAAAASVQSEPRSSGGCRVMSKRGSVLTATGEAVDKGHLLLGERWLVLEPGAALSLKHTSSGREVTFEGPGRVLPCLGGEEEMIVGSGAITTQANTGVRPGATVVIGTPYGSVRYADAQARLVVGAQGLEVPEASGDLSLVPILPPADPVPLTGPGAKLPSVPTSADEALAACTRAVEAAGGRARALLEAAPGTQGQLAGEHVRARRQARLTCASATAAALAQGKDAADIAARLKRLSELRALWRAVPEK
jgi:hypothetical protein